WTEEVRTESPDTEESQLFLAPIQHATEEKEPISQWIRQRIARGEEAERKRLFYVACTRARGELHLFAAVAKNEKGEISNPDKRSLLYIAWPFAEEIFAQYASGLATTPTTGNLRTMPQTAIEPESDIALAASGQSVHPAKLWLSNFRRLPSDWAPSPPLTDVLSATHPEWIVETAGDPAPAFQRPEGSWKARMFGTVVHALLQPLAGILRSNHAQDAAEKAIQNLHRPTLLRLMQGGYAPKDALTAADRILRVLLEVSHDPCAQWLLAAYPNVDSMLPDFEVPLTALVRNAVRSVRLDRMFVAGQEPLTAGNHQLWIVDFKTATHGSGDLAQFLDEQQRQYTDQMHVYAEVVRAAYPQALPIHLGLYYPLLQKFIWWPEVAGIDADI
ncbi:MAG TPA: PD-(D/E)XK nuclease family protein, partial [Acidobacteriaceae bacterium]|nr:PD-(D/E)XK nuclease family protein [Acidobacteriaceae bacterium]